MGPNYGLYAYGLVGKSLKQFAVLGIDKQNKVFPLERGDLSVIVSEIDVGKFQEQVKNLFSELTRTGGAAQRGTEELLQAHEDVVEALLKDTTVVPFTFGTILKDEKAAAKMLQDDEEKFKKLLAKFTGRAEWGLKVYADTQEFIQQSVLVEPEFKNLEARREKLSRGTAYLLGRKMEEELKDTVVARLAPVTEGIFQDLGNDAYEAKLNKTLPQKLTGKKKEMVLNTVFLVEQEKVAHFCKKGKKLMQKYASMGLDLEVSGPWPPYSFTY